jgi:hypothetical protein
MNTAPIKHTTKPAPPLRRHVLLTSAGIKPDTFTRHEYHDAELKPDPPIGAGGYGLGWLRPQWDLLYKCTKTGAIKKYGVVDATDYSDKMRDEEGGLL